MSAPHLNQFQLAPILMISAIASGQGKTTVTAALARRWRRQGRRVRVFKTGADFIDPMILERASGSVVESLDLWLLGEARCRALLAQAAQESDLVLVEGVMGLYDGQPSSADLAKALDLPVLVVIDAAAMAQTAAAVVQGLRDYGAAKVQGVLANRVGSSGHATMIQEAMAAIPPSVVFPEVACELMAYLPRQATSFPERHLGLVLPSEQSQLEANLDALADSLQIVDSAWERITAPAWLAQYRPDLDDDTVPNLLAGRWIAVARDAAFCFLYPANLACLQAMGAQLVYFSPLNDEPIPAQANALYLPGGYPELHAARLAEAKQWQASVREFHLAARPIYAECGGMMSLAQTLIDQEEGAYPMAGLLRGTMHMQTRLAALGMQRLYHRSGVLRGHTFHYSRFETDLQPASYCWRQRSEDKGEAVYRQGSLIASYFHAYFPSNPCAAAQLFLETDFFSEAI